MSLHAEDKRPGDYVNVRARVWSFNNQVQVDVWNSTQVDIECRGMVNIRTQNGQTQTEYYWETIYRGQTRTRTFWLRDFNDRVTSAFDSINCYER